MAYPAAFPHRRTSRPIPTFSPVLLDVTLRRGDEIRQWSIHPRDIGWDCRVLRPTSITVSGCDSLDQALTQKHEWEAEIIRARADGWS